MGGGGGVTEVVGEGGREVAGEGGGRWWVRGEGKGGGG